MSDDYDESDLKSLMTEKGSPELKRHSASGWPGRNSQNARTPTRLFGKLLSIVAGMCNFKFLDSCACSAGCLGFCVLPSIVGPARL